MRYREANLVPLRKAYIRNAGSDQRNADRSVSRVLGHTNIVTTQIYAKITTQKLNTDLTMFGDKLVRHLTV